MKCTNPVRTNKLVDFEVSLRYKCFFYTYGVGVCGTVPTATEHMGLLMNDLDFLHEHCFRMDICVLILFILLNPRLLSLKSFDRCTEVFALAIELNNNTTCP